MMKLWSTFLIVLLSVTSFSSDWKLEKNKNGIKVYTRELANSDIKEFKAIATIDAPRLKIARVLTRAGDFMNWMPQVDDSRVLRIVSPTKRIVYYSTDMPWPTDDRDVVLDLWVESDNANQTTWIKMKENLTEKREVDGMVRMTNASGYYKLTSISDNKTEVHYEFQADPAGSLPAWLINMFIVDAPYDTIMALREQVK
mgnify:CR=1 FL=1